MKTHRFEIKENQIDTNMLDEAARLLDSGELVAFPTETVYGLGADALNSNAVAGIFAAKGRPADNPLIVHIHSREQMYSLAETVPREAEILADHFWPGPLTMILEAKDSVPLIVTAGLSTVAIRMPSHPVALELLRRTRNPVAAPSANLSGKPSPTRGEHVLEDLEGKISGVILAEKSRIGLESTVIDMTESPAVILRPGSITGEEISRLIPVIDYQPEEQGSKRSPGTRYRHYAPEGEMILIQGEWEDKLRRFREILSEPAGEGEAFLVTHEMALALQAESFSSRIFVELGSAKRPWEIAANFYEALRYLDKIKASRIFVEGLPEEIAGKALTNRLLKATGGDLS